MNADRIVYLDHNATTPLEPAARAAMLPFLGGEFGNPSSAHRLGSAARCAVEEARAQVAELLGAEPRQIVFTSGGTEANNLALAGVQGRVLASPIEHSSVLEPLRARAAAGALRLELLPVDGAGRVEPAALEAALAGETALVSVAWANNEIGTVQPLAAIADLCRRRGVPLHSDAVQAAGKVEIDARADLLSLSAHKLGGPKGVGALCLRPGARLAPLLLGGSQERGRRAGTENVAGIVGFGAACALAGRRLARAAAIEALREELWARLADLPGIARNSPRHDCLPNTLNLGLRGRAGDALVAALDLAGVAVSTGSACAAGASEPSHVLLALGRSPAEARDAIRFSLGPETTADDVARAAAALRAIAGAAAEAHP